MITVVPHEGTDIAAFGESRQALRARLGDYRTLPPTAPVDQYVERGMLLHFDESDRLEFIEITQAGDSVEFDHVLLVGRPSSDVVRDLAEHGLSLERDDVGYQVTSAGFGLYVPGFEDEDDALVEAVSIFPPGYYDEA